MLLFSFGPLPSNRRNSTARAFPLRGIGRIRGCHELRALRSGASSARRGQARQLAEGPVLEEQEEHQSIHAARSLATEPERDDGNTTDIVKYGV